MRIIGVGRLGLIGIVLGMNHPDFRIVGPLVVVAIAHDLHWAIRARRLTLGLGRFSRPCGWLFLGLQREFVLVLVLGVLIAVGRILLFALILHHPRNRPTAATPLDAPSGCDKRIPCRRIIFL